MSSNQPPWGGNGPGWPPSNAPGTPAPTPSAAPSAPSGGHPVPATPYAPPSPYGAPPGAPAGGYPVPASPYGAPPAAQSPYAAPPPYAGPPDPYAAFAQSQPGVGGSPYPYAPPSAANPYAAYTAQPAGFAGGQPVQGWLLFLCVWMTILNPLMSLSRILPFLGRLSAFGPMFAFDTLLNVALTGFSIYAGAGLWNKRAGAVRLAKVYFMVRGGYSLLSYLLFITRFGSVGFMSSQGVIALVICGIWLAYLTQSQRVRDAYGP